MLRRPLVLAAALGLVLGFAAPASAWDRDIHLSIVRGAMSVSAAAEARVPLEYRDAVLREIVEPDPYDKDCMYHCSAAAPRDAATEAAKILAILGNPKIPLSKYQRAQTIGRYLHFVADAVSPLSVRQGAAPKLLNFFANQDFILFREARPISGDLAAALRQRAAEVGWANANLLSTNPWLFRFAVNTVADAMLLLPPRPDAAGARDSGSVIFLVNRIDNGTAGRSADRYKYVGSFYTEGTGGDLELWDEFEWTPGASHGSSFYKPNLMERQGVHLVEVAAHKEASRVLLRLMLFNNSNMCARPVAVKAGSWKWTLPGTMPPNAIKVVELEAPADVLNRKLSSKASTDNCQGGTLAGGTLPTEPRVIYGNGGDAPKFDAVLMESDISHGTDRPKSGARMTN